MTCSWASGSQLLVKQLFQSFFFQRDFEVREMREFNKTVMKQIGDVVNQHQDLGEIVSLYFSQVSKRTGWVRLQTLV